MARPKTGGSSQQILEAAESLFAERGPNGVSIDDIAVASGVARSSVFWHFQSKAGLVEAVVDRIGQRAFDSISGAADGKRGLGAFEAAVEARITLMTEAPAVVRLLEVLLGEALTLEPQLAPHFAHYEGLFLANVRQWFREAVEDNELPHDADTESLAVVATAALSGIVARWLRAGASYDPVAAHRAVLRVLHSLEPGPRQRLRRVPRTTPVPKDAARRRTAS